MVRPATPEVSRPPTPPLTLVAVSEVPRVELSAPSPGEWDSVVDKKFSRTYDVSKVTVANTLAASAYPDISTPKTLATSSAVSRNGEGPARDEKFHEKIWNSIELTVQSYCEGHFLFGAGLELLLPSDRLPVGVKFTAATELLSESNSKKRFSALKTPWTSMKTAVKFDVDATAVASYDGCDVPILVCPYPTHADQQQLMGDIHQALHQAKMKYVILIGRHQPGTLNAGYGNGDTYLGLTKHYHVERIFQNVSGPIVKGYVHWFTGGVPKEDPFPSSFMYAALLVPITATNIPPRSIGNALNAKKSVEVPIVELLERVVQMEVQTALRNFSEKLSE